MLLQFSRFSHDARGFVTFLVAACIAFVIGIAFHEFSHAFVAYLLGDTTAQSMGRLSLNPVRHLDPTGTLLLLFVGFGWGKPTPVNPNRLRNGPRAGMALVSIAGPISNFLMATLFALPLKLNLVTLSPSLSFAHWTLGNYLALICIYVVIINVVLGLFNLIPLAPLDGSKIAIGILPAEMGDFFRRIEPYGIGILMLLFALSWFSPQFNLVGRLIGPLENGIVHLLTGLRLG